MDLLVCSEEMMPETPEGTVQAPENMTEILRRRQLSCDLKFTNDGNGPQARADANLVNSRMLQEMLKMEEVMHEQISPQMFVYTQDLVKPSMRQDTLCWMYEVCEAEEYPEWVFLRACSYMDRVLSVYRILPNQLQLLGVVCLTISLKFHGVTFSLDKLLYYTADSVPKNLILDWELMVLYGLKWDMSTIVPTDFIQIFEEMCPRSWFPDNVMHQVSTYLSFCATDCTFIAHTPSTIAVASLTVAISLLISKETGEQALDTFHQLTNIDKELIRIAMEKLQIKIAHTLIPEENLTIPGCNPGLNNNNNVISKHSIVSFRVEEPMVLDKIEEMAQAETPTDSHIQILVRTEPAAPPAVTAPPTTAALSSAPPVIDLYAYETLECSPL